jgi:uncharacterized protein
MIASVGSQALDYLPPDLRVYLPTAVANARNNLIRADLANGRTIIEILAETRKSHVGSAPDDQKLRRMRHFAAEFNDQFALYSACKNSCSHCCNKSVLVSKIEAKPIALCIRTPLAKLVMTHRAGDKVERTSYQGTPCTFLVAGKCSIYEHRPLVCRMLVNMDSDERLCKLNLNKLVPAAFLNNIDFQMFYADLLGKKNLADVREWFPKGLR